MLALPAHAAETVQDLLTICEEGERGNTFKGGQCLGYIDGAVSAVATQLSMNAPEALRFRYCSSAMVTFGQMRALFMKHAKENPKFWNAPADIHVMAALVVAFPCSK